MPNDTQGGRHTAKDRLFVLGQYLLPQHLLSRLLGKLADCRIAWLKNALIGAFVRRYRVDLREAQTEEPAGYPTFNAFFTRALKDEARPMDADPRTLISPVDGQVSQLGAVRGGQLFQAKGHNFSALELLGGDQRLAARFQDGAFATLYLSPRDYHRVHMPVAATLKEMLYIPGRLFSVNRVTAECVPGLFARNERVICLFETEQGPLAMVLVGAMIVASIETSWAGLITPPTRTVRRTHYDQQPVCLDKGEEMGRFLLGSTVILLFGPGQINWAPGLTEGVPVRMGQPVAFLQDNSA